MTNKSSSSNPSRLAMAQALAQARAMGGQAGEPGLQSPPGQQMLENLAHVASGYGMGSAGANILAALAKKGVPALQGLGEAGAVFPEGTPPESLPEIAAGSKTGDPHALFAYHDDFGPNMTKRAVYNVFGDPAHPTIKEVGLGSSVGEDVLKKFGIPIVGREAPRSFLQKGFH